MGGGMNNNMNNGGQMMNGSMMASPPPMRTPSSGLGGGSMGMNSGSMNSGGMQQQQQQQQYAPAPSVIHSSQLLERVAAQPYGKEKIDLIKASAPQLVGITAKEVKQLLSTCPYGTDEIVELLYLKVTDKQSLETELYGILSRTTLIKISQKLQPQQPPQQSQPIQQQPQQSTPMQQQQQQQQHQQHQQGPPGQSASHQSMQLPPPPTNVNFSGQVAPQQIASPMSSQNKAPSPAAAIDPTLLENAYKTLQQLQDEKRKLYSENQNLSNNLAEVAARAKEAQSLEKSLNSREAEIQAKEREKGTLQQKLSEKDALIQQLQAQLASLTLVHEDSYNSDLIGQQLTDLDVGSSSMGYGGGWSAADDITTKYNSSNVLAGLEDLLDLDDYGQ